MIGDKGATELSKFIAKNDRDFENLELSRNNIGEKGG